MAHWIIQSTAIIAIVSAGFGCVKHQLLAFLKVFYALLEVIDEQLVLALLILDEAVTYHGFVAVEQGKTEEEEDDGDEDRRECEDLQGAKVR